MKSTPRLSGPVLAFGIVCFAICALVGWYALKDRKHSATGESLQTEVAATTPAETSSATETNLDEPVVAYDLSQGIPPVIPISLVPVLVEAENSTWLKDVQYLRIPRGTQDLGGIEFHLEGMIQLQGRASKEWKGRSYRTSVSVPVTLTNVVDGNFEIIERGSNISSVYLLAGTRYDGDQDSVIANVVWRYTDGSSASSPVQYGVHVRDWVREVFESPEKLSYPFTKVVWAVPDLKQSEQFLRLYRFGLANPQPRKVVRQLDLVSTMAEPTLFVVGLTLDPLRLGERPDSSRDLEPTDSVSGIALGLIVVGPDNQLVPNARIEFRILRRDGRLQHNLKRMIKTDDSGLATLRFLAEEMKQLQVSVSHDDFGAKKMVWDTESGDVIPASYTIKLGSGITIGGTVVDDADQPIAGAKLSLGRFWTGDDDMHKKGEQPDYPSKTITTDAMGGWQAKGLPAELLDRISLYATHADFVGTGLTVGGKADEESKLRDGTHKLVLKRGLFVRGRVTDESDSPIKDAQVWAGKQYHSGIQDTKSDAKGEFSFRNLKEEEIQFSVLAKGMKPETKNITVKPGMAEIVFKLGKGSVIRGVVRNEAGEAISDVRLSLQSRSMDGSESYPFSMKSDKDGRFEWDGAPDEPQRFSIYKEGYESKGSQTLKVAEENVVTLRKGRKVQGWVVDAETDKPITKFRVGVGQRHEFGDSERFYANPGMKEFSDPNGMFILTVSDEQSNAVKGESDEYAEKMEKLPAAEDGVVKVTLRLKPSPALRGILVDSQGSPVAGGTVALTKGDSMGGGSIQLRNGRLSSYDQGNKVVTTDASGNFKLSSPPESGGIVVGAAAVGFGSAPTDQVRSSGRLMLQGFGRIEGTIKVAGVPTAGQQFTFNIANIGVSYQSDGFATSDEQGKFTFEKLPAGDGSVVRLIKMTENSWRHSHNTSVTIEPGKTTQVSFGEDGAVIKGRVHLETQPAEGEKLTFDAMLHTKMPPMTEKFSTPEEWQVFYKSPEYKERMKQMKNYGVTIGADGTFSADSIPPGEYTFTVTAGKPGEDRWNMKPVATGSTTVTIPENSTPYSPVFVPDIFLKPVQKP